MFAEILGAVANGAKGGTSGSGASGYGQANQSTAAGSSDGAAYAKSPFDSSNWTVSTGGGKASATNSGGLAIPPEYLLIGAVLLLIVWKKVH